MIEESLRVKAPKGLKISVIFSNSKINGMEKGGVSVIGNESKVKAPRYYFS